VVADPVRVALAVGFLMNSDDHWKHERREIDRRYLLRKTLDAAENRMRMRTAKQQLADAMAASRGPDEIPLPDADDSSVRGVMS
jgi:hypothetical protein